MTHTIHLVQQVKNNCGIQDDNQARMYTQEAAGLLRENANNDPQGLSSLWQFRRRTRTATRGHWQYGRGVAWWRR